MSHAFVCAVLMYMSLCQADCRIFLHVSLDTPLPSSSALMGAMSSGIIEKIRLYLDIIPCLNYNLSEDAQKVSVQLRLRIKKIWNL